VEPASKETQKIGLGIDVRSSRFLSEARSLIADLRRRAPAGGQAGGVDVLFLEASDVVLVRRYSETRRRHPLGGDLVAGIAADRRELDELRGLADQIIDTSQLNVHQLKDLIKHRYGSPHASMMVTLMSFGFKHGLPGESNLVFDVRFLPNPYFVEELADLSGLDAPVARFVLSQADAQEFLRHTESLLRFALPRFQAEGKAYLTIAIGCTGGRHRSVALAEDLAGRLSELCSCSVRHRDVERGT
jgi:UPF0042 nucleotide-binding protein